MREIRTSGSEGGAGVIPPFLPLSVVEHRNGAEGPCIVAITRTSQF